MTNQSLKFGLVVLCAVGVSSAALFCYGAAAVQSEPRAAAVPVDCLQARGAEGVDFWRYPHRPICFMSLASFQRLYPEVAEHTDGSSWANEYMIPSAWAFHASRPRGLTDRK